MGNKIYNGGYVPVNRAAAVGISPQKTDKITLPPKFYREHWFDPPPMREIENMLRKNPEFKDLAGLKVGRRAVIGLSEKTAGHYDAYWVLRCVCGVYELQRAQAIKKANVPDGCCWCEYNDYLRHDGNRQLRPTSDGAPWSECPALDTDAVELANPNFTQANFGELTVLGLPLENPNGFRAWIVQCSCGLYERRSIKSILKKFGRKEKLMCAACSFKLTR